MDFKQELSAGLGEFGAEFALLALAGKPISEDSVRDCLVRGFHEACSLPLSAIHREYPLAGRPVDLWIPPMNLAIEFKYWRSIPSGRNRPMSQHFGDLLADFNKLATTQSIDRLVILASDQVGHYYLLNSSRGLTPLSLRIPKRIGAHELATLSTTSSARALGKGPWTPLSVELIWRSSTSGWHLFAWRVAPWNVGQ